MKKLTADVVVIGAGTAGMGAFRNALLHTQNVYLIENHTYGTTCARVGCMPSKLLIAAAEARHHALHTDPFGVHLDKDSVQVNGKEVMARVKAERDRFVGFVVEDVLAWDESKRINIPCKLTTTRKSTPTASSSPPVRALPFSRNGKPWATNAS